MAWASLVILDLLHQHLLLMVGGTLGEVRHTRGTAGVRVPVEGVGPVGTGWMSRWRVAWWWRGVLRRHDLGVLVGRHHLAVGHDLHVGVGHGREPLHGDHPVGHSVQRHDRDASC